MYRSKSAATSPSTDEKEHKSRPSKKVGLLSTGDMARLTQSTVRTVRFYEEAGVLHPATRSDGNHRLFDRSELDKFQLVLDLRTAGLSLDDIKAILLLKESESSGASASVRVTQALNNQLQQMRERIAALTRLEQEFSRSVEFLAACSGCHDNPRFPLQCGSCDVLRAHLPEPPRALRVLWQVALDDDTETDENDSSSDQHPVTRSSIELRRSGA